MRRLFLLGVIEALFALSVSTAAAASVTFEFAGTVTRVQDEQSVLDGSVAVGTPFSGFYTFESTSADHNPEPNVGGYDIPAPPGAFRLVVGNYTFEILSGQSYTIVVDNSDPLDGRDRYVVVAGWPIGVTGPFDPLVAPVVGYFTSVSLGMSAPPPGPLTDDQLLLAPPTLSEWGGGGVGIEFAPSGFVEFAIEGELVTIVPEPSSAVLLAPALLLAAMRVRGRRYP